MAENPLFDEVVAIYDHLVDNPDAARIVEREAQRVFLVEAYHDLRARVDFLLERRRQLDQVVNLLLFIRTYAIIKRALRRLLPAAALVFVAGTAAVVVYVEWRRGTVPTFETFGMIFTRLMCFFL
ncbi:hypothetical protein DAI22_01g291200 [Oryza sativa Japonica Group]|nr:hypothetical protein DAI22_01g291200 [Oryza sativa Japonica Group]